MLIEKFGTVALFGFILYAIIMVIKMIYDLIKERNQWSIRLSIIALFLAASAYVFHVMVNFWSWFA